MVVVTADDRIECYPRTMSLLLIRSMALVGIASGLLYQATLFWSEDTFSSFSYVPSVVNENSPNTVREAQVPRSIVARTDNPPMELVVENGSNGMTNSQRQPALAAGGSKKDKKKSLPSLQQVQSTATASDSAIPSCSCFNETNECCRRSIFRNHKMGFVLIGNLYEKFKREDGLFIGLRLPPEKGEIHYQRKMEQKDYRTVFTVRNWFDALVSGYLYHKSGFECWINAYGQTKLSDGRPFVGWIGRLDWEKEIVLPYPYPPANNRSFCTYLAEESEYDGMRVYVEFALGRYHTPLVDMYESSRRYEDPKNPKTLFACFEDLSNHKTQVETGKRILEFLWPGKQKKLEHSPPKEEYEGVHSTSKDGDLRSRLRSIVERLDREAFNSTITKWTNIFGCGVKKDQ